MTQKKKNNFAMIAGVLLAVFTVWRLFPLVFSIEKVLLLLGCGVLIFSLFTKRRNIVPCVGFAALAVSELLSLVNGTMLSGFMKFFIWTSLFGYLAATAICVAELSDYLPQGKEFGKKFLFVPVILVGLYLILSTYMVINYFRNFPYFIRYIIFTIGILLTMLWVAYPEGLPVKQAPASSFEAGGSEVSGHVNSEMYCDLAKHILLLFFTFGIWLLIWIYRMTGYTNGIKDEEDRNPATKLLLCMFVPFYQIYWTYKTAQRIDKMAKDRNVQSDLSTICLILAIFVSIVPPILMQDKLNSIVKSASNPYATQTVTAPAQPTAQPKVNTADELKSYKDLLDSGVITQEEFDAKKKQLLGL